MKNTAAFILCALALVFATLPAYSQNAQSPGAGSDFSWNALAVPGYRFMKDITDLIGYRALYVDYKAGTSSIRYNATIHGPVLGLSFSFQGVRGVTIFP